jgi:hypothetical protein
MCYWLCTTCLKERREEVVVEGEGDGERCEKRGAIERTRTDYNKESKIK